MYNSYKMDLIPKELKVFAKETNINSPTPQKHNSHDSNTPHSSPGLYAQWKIDTHTPKCLPNVVYALYTIPAICDQQRTHSSSCNGLVVRQLHSRVRDGEEYTLIKFELDERSSVSGILYTA